MPKVFVSYSWDDEEHKRWVRELAARLRGDGIETLLDHWHLVPGDQLPAFMESSVRESDFVLVICTPRYKDRSDARAGGVGYEGHIMTGEIYTSRNHRKFIPLLARSTWSRAAPSWLQGSFFLDFTRTPPDEGPYEDLLRTVLGKPSAAPPLGMAAVLAPAVRLNALLGNQDTITVNLFISDDAARGYNEFLWPAAYELQNMGSEQLTVMCIENLLPSIRVGDHELALTQRNPERAVIVLYDNFRALVDKAHDAPTDWLPFTLRAGAKVYLKVLGSYVLTDNGNPVFCRSEEKCYELLTYALGGRLNDDGTRPAIVKEFKTRLMLRDFGSTVFDQRAFLVTPGCFLDLSPAFDSLVRPGDKR